MKTLSMMQVGALALSLLTTSVMAAVSPQEAAQLGTTLTPMGAQKEGNADGSIPAWTGGLKPGAAPVTKGFLGDPYQNEKPLFVITSANAEQYKSKLTPGQMAMFKRFPDTYKIPVYTTHRSSSFPNRYTTLLKKALCRRNWSTMAMAWPILSIAVTTPFQYRRTALKSISTMRPAIAAGT